MHDLALQNQRLRKLAEVVEQIAAVRDLTALMNVLRPAIREVCGADGATLVLNDNGYCHYVDEDAIGPLWKGQKFPLEDCISGWAMIHAQPAVIEDIYADPRIPHDAYRPTFVKSLSMVPVGRAAPVAAIGCYWASRHRATTDELELQQALADAMSVGLANVTLYRNLEQRVLEHTRAEQALAKANRQLQTDLDALAKLQELSALFVREGDIRSVLERMVDVAMDFSDADFGTIQLVDPEAGELRLVAHRNFPKWWLDFWETVSHGEGACGTAMARGERVIVEDVEQSAVFVGTAALDVQLRVGVRAVQTTPLVSRAGKLLGMLATHYRKPCRPDERALNLIDLLARQAADIIDRGQLNEALACAKSAAEAANDAKTAFLANMSHEIRTPLHVIIGSANLLARDISDSRKQARVNQLLENSEHLLGVINDVLELSKIEAQTLSVENVDLVLDSIVARVRRMLEVRVQEKGLGLHIELAPELRGITLRGDVSRLTQVLVNLCTNAIKFTHRGSVTLKVERVGELPNGGHRVRFSVEDTGIGIAPEDQERVFQSFEQVDPSLSRRYDGSGLGLTICQRLVGLMGGSILVSSELAKGSTFSFDLVMRPGTSAPPVEAEPTEVPDDFFGARILIAEDHPQSQEILLDMLDELGCEGDIARDGVEAVELAGSGSYDAILMDMHMPNMDGLAATRAIRALRQHAKTPIIALTANAFAEDRQRCLDAGMDCHLSKPVTPATLAIALGNWLPHTSANNPESSCESDLIRTLRQVPGLSVRSIWLRSDDHALRYHAQLIRFAEAETQDLEALHRHLLACDYERAHTLAHRLKGIAGMLGATRVEAVAHEMAQSLRGNGDKTGVSDLATRCAAELDGLTRNLQQIPAAPAPRKSVM